METRPAPGPLPPPSVSVLTMLTDAAESWRPAAWANAAWVRRYFMIDVFTDTPLEGNQLGVFVDGTDLPGESMQRAARELNLSETVFVLGPQAGGDARVRIFTPIEELPFAGHPVLGTAVLLGELLGRDVIRLETGAGVVPVEVERADDQAAFGWMEQPLPTWQAYPDERRLLSALGLEASGLPVEEYANGPQHVYVELPSAAAVASLRPDLTALAELPVGVSCFAGAGGRWKTRMFAPALGIDEDPATGSAAGPLAVHLARHGRTEFGRQVDILQGAEVGRPSLLHARAVGSADRLEQVRVGGAAVVVAKGEYRLA